MNVNYVITNDYLKENYGLDLNDYALEGDLIPAIINIALDKATTIFCEYNDNIKSSRALENYLGQDDSYYTAEEKQEAFKKLQYEIVYRLIFESGLDIKDEWLISILAKQLGCKINGFQKGIFQK